MYMLTLLFEQESRPGRSHKPMGMQAVNPGKKARLARESDLGAIQREAILTVVRAEPLGELE